MKGFMQDRLAKAAALRAPAAGIMAGVAFAALFVTACENGGGPTSATSNGDSRPQYNSFPQVTPVTSVPQARAYPGTKVVGEVSVCKDVSSPAGNYTFSVSAAGTHTADLIASSVTISAGQCSIVYNRHSRPPGNSPITSVTITEVIPAQATYTLSSVSVNDDLAGTRTASGPSVTVTANANHGSYATFLNVANGEVPPPPPPPPPPPFVDLGGAASFGILAGTTVTCVTGGVVNADVGVSPGSAITGFGPCVLTGVKHAADATAATAQTNLTTAYNTLAGLACPNTIVADLGGTTKLAGVYCSASSIGVTGTLTLDGGGNPNAVFVFQAGSTLTTAGDIVLINGAQARNVYWQVGSSATLGTGSHWQGNILALTSITLNDYVTLIGRALARNGAVTLGTNNVIILP